MSLVAEQNKFLQDVVKLLVKAWEMGFTVTAGEVYRPTEMQAIYVKTGRSNTMHSKHNLRLAIDLNIFKDGQLTYDPEIIAPLGTYWQSLSRKNKWGGNFSTLKDTPHFERNPWA
jgi:hypothetical protein